MIVTDSTVLTSMTLAGEADLLSRLFGEVGIPATAWRGVMATLQALGADVEPPEGVVRVVQVDMAEGAMTRDESEVLELCRQEQAKVLLSDDPALRSEAAKRGLRCISTLGVLYAAHVRGRIADVSGILQNLCSAGYGVSSPCAQALLRRCS